MLYNINVHGVQYPCTCCTISMYMVYNIHVHAVQYQCTCCTISMYMLYNIHLHAVQYPCTCCKYQCTCCTISMYMLYNINIHAVQYQCTRCTISMYMLFPLPNTGTYFSSRKQMAVGSFCMQTVTVRDLITANFPRELVNSVMPPLIHSESLQRVV